MDPTVLPEDISTLSDEELAKLKEQITAEGAKLGEAEDATDEVVNTLEALATALDVVLAEETKRTDAAAERASRLQAARGKFASPDPENADGDEGQGDGGEGAEGADDGAAAPQGEPALVASKGTPRGLANRRPSSAAPVERKSDFMMATGHALVPSGTQFATVDDVAKAIADKRNHFGTIPSRTREPLVIATGVKSGIKHQVGADPIKNFGIVRAVQEEMSSLVASAGYLAPLSPILDFFRLAEPQTPVEDGLAVVQADRGGIRFLQPAVQNTSTAHGGPYAVDETYDPTTKPVQRMTTPSVLEREVEAISQILEFDNLQYRVFPEQVAAFLEDVAVAFASKKEVYYLDYINSVSVHASADLGYGATRSLLRDWHLGAVAYRKRHGMRRDRRLQVFAPDWSIEAIRADMALQNNAQTWEISDAQILAAIRARGLDPVWYNDNPTGISPSQKFNGAQATGALNKWPTMVTSFMMAPGTIVRLDGGTLDVGLYRDSVLNGTNDLQIFMEEWIGTAQLGFQSVRIDSTITVNGAAPDYVTAATATA